MKTRTGHPYSITFGELTETETSVLALVRYYIFYVY